MIETKFIDELLNKSIKEYDLNDLKELANEIREFQIQSISKTGGHIGANLGVIELTISLHYVFDIEKDKLLFDVGHQGYTHKLLTGRKDLFSTLNTIDGMSRFISPKESPYDILDASHGGTAISIGTGIAYANKKDNIDSKTIAIVGDGAFVEGMSFEGLNYSTSQNLPLIIVINDNGMSIPKNVGAVNMILSTKQNASNFFNSMGFEYFYIDNGHNLDEAIQIFQQAKNSPNKKTIIVHVKTTKGYGLEISKNHPYRLHFSMPFNPSDSTTTAPAPTGNSYTQIVGDTLYNLIKNDKNIYVITASTPYASGLDKLIIDFPDNAIDVGMAEQQAAGMAAGLSMSNKIVFLCYQSTFMQRAMDQIFHDICFMNLPVTIIASRSGFAGFDSPTHHAIYDLSYLRGLPNLEIFYAGTSKDLKNMIELRKKTAKKPMIILHPYEAIRADEEKYFSEDSLNNNETLFTGKDGYILSVGNRLSSAIELREKLKTFNKDVGIINNRWIQPLQVINTIELLQKVNFAITLEENVLDGGFGSAISELIIDNDINTKLIRIAIKNGYTSTGDKDYLSKLEKIDVDSIIKQLKTRGIL
ncbi:1-deoxy-D-xylulose-5-phosphate synthase [Aliarcobacter cryaerophilus]|uniref:1-deoxy-D-xylulose-5-phosphate synthase n=1 Tax=Aliarcobacter cryaerophilus TaxID=28198 RepID=UPI003DA2048B